jgi:hypothetical protein
MLKKLTSMVAVTAVFMLVGSAQAGTLIVGKDYRGAPPAGGVDDPNNLKAYNTLTGDLLWEVEAGIGLTGGELDRTDPFNITLVAANAGSESGGTDNVTRYNVQTGAVVGGSPLYNHGIGFALDVAVHPDTGDIYHTGATYPPGHFGVRVADVSNGNNLLNFDASSNNSEDLLFLQTPSELLLFIMSFNARYPVARLVNGDPPTSISISGTYGALPPGTAPRSMTINPNNNLLYATDDLNSVYQWNPVDSTSPPVLVLDDPTNLQGASGLAFDELNNLYVTERTGDGDPQLGDASTKTADIYKYTPNGGGTWDFDSVFATVEDTHVFNNGSPLFMQYLEDTGPLPTDFNWTQNDLGSWTSSGSWDPQIVPNSADHTVTFGGVATTATTAVVNTNVTVNKITFGSAQQYVVGGAGSVNLAATTDVTPVDPTIEVLLGSHQFQAIVNLQASATANVGDGLTLSFNNELNLGGNTLTKTGGGNMAINNKLITAGGSVNLQQGTVSGSGTVGGNLNNSSGTVAPGNSPGILTIDGDYTQGSSGIMEMEIGGLVAGQEHDKIVIIGAANLAGTLDVSLINSYSPNNGDTYDILDFGSVNGDFGTTNLPANFSWDVATGVLTFMDVVGLTDYDNDGTWGLGDLNLVLFNWNEDGAILPATWINSRPPGGTLVGLPELNQVLFNWGQPGSLATVPEPATWMLGCLGLLFGLRFRRRRRAG